MGNNENAEAPDAKKPRLSKKEKKKLKGQNKNRGPTYQRELSKELCNSLIDQSENNTDAKCLRKNCQLMHDVKEYLKIKPVDICR